ncbi:MAG: AAA family ATPase [Bacteriovoracia bacterium]
MILEQISLEPFAGFAKKEISFTPGLNVVLGPNDVGKSSLFRAVDAAFFLPAKVRANTVEGKGLKRLIPIGSDHAKVRIRFSVGGLPYELEKNWGANFASRLKLPEGNVLISGEALEAKLLELLPAPPATFQAVLLTPQNSLERTKEEFEKNPDSLHSLGDALRKAVELAGGVSLEKMKSELGLRITQALDNWDVNAGAPRGLRGIENPWQKNVGTVLEAYYRRERLRKELGEARALESELGDKLKILGVKQALLQENRDFLQKNQASVEAVAARRNLELELAQAEKDLRNLTDDLDAWKTAEADLKLLGKEVARLEEKKNASEAEWKSVRAGADRKSFLARFAKIQAAHERFKETERALAALPAVKSEDLKKITQVAAAVAQSKAAISGGKIKLQFLAKQKMELSVQKNADPARSGTLESGGTMLIQGGGKVQISSEAFEIVVTSGEGKIVDGEKALQTESAVLASLLEKWKLGSAEEAQEKHEKWLMASGALREAEGIFKSLLERDDFSSLQKRFETDQEAKPGRDAELVEKELQEANTQFAEKKSALAVAQRLLQDLAKRNSVADPAALMRLLVKKTADSESLAAKLKALPPLPAGLEEVDAYVAKFRRLQAELPTLAEEVRVVSNSVAELKARMKPDSAQEYDRLHREAEEVFSAQLKKAKALLRVGEVLRELEAPAGDIYRDFRAGFDRFVNELSAGKYGKAKMQASLPSEFLRRDGAEIPFEWLSAGTKDAFALALRLSMAKYFLGAARGFLLIDDPMVAMDPVRQRAVAELLRGFADGVQLVVFTCHPAHAEMLGGNLIQLG